MDVKSVRVRVPASTANLGPGFDSLGMAFQLYTELTMTLADQTVIKLIGKEMEGLRADKSNLIYQTAATLFTKAGLPVPELEIEVESHIPLTRGLGSSAAAIVGALTAANVLAGEPFSQDQLFAIASDMEGHPDNVGASFFGGVVVASMPEDGEMGVPFVKLPVLKGLQTLVVIPDYWLSTEEARKALPDSYSRADFVYNIGHSSLLVAALAQGRLDLLGKAMRDRLHQPYRAKLVPGLQEILTEATNYGALGAALSGAGPTTLFFYSGDEQKERLLAFVEGIMAKYRISYRSMVLAADNQGVRIEERE
ncbi:MAG TPA: homoserine kinase [Candidatus Bathyarchaeia archaeon]|nr:homoserine kinase [Candidatus Bathyarchaeia archaeon]